MIDPRTVRLVAGFLGLVVLATLGGTFALLLTDRSVDPTVVSVGSLALGGLIGLLTPNGGTQDVRVRQPADDPVPVEPA